MRLLGCLVGLSAGCNTQAPLLDFEASELDELSFYRQQAGPPADPTNAVSEDPNAAALGQFLFFDLRLSGSGEFSCASCHDPEQGFGDGLALSQTIGTSGRHAMTLLNAAYQDFFYWDGRADSLWAQALSPIENEVEMGGSREGVAALILSDSELFEAYESVFGALPESPISPQEVDRLFSNVGKAIAAYEQQLVRQDAPFDRFLEALLAGDPDAGSWMSLEAQRGLRDFIGDAGCHFCHFGPQFSNNDFHNIGLAVPPWDQPFDGGRFDGIPKLKENPFNGSGAFSDDPESGALKIDHLVQTAEQLGQFKTPSLRNLLSTAPYMHAGHFEDLEDVLIHYAGLKSEVELGHREEVLLPLQDSTGQRLSDLKAFLEALEGEPLDASLMTPPSSPFVEN